jgi:hypothetical protein
MFAGIYGFQEIEKLNNYLLHVLNVKAHIGTNLKEKSTGDTDFVYIQIP